MDGTTRQCVTLGNLCSSIVSTEAVLNIEPQPYHGLTEIRRRVVRPLVLLRHRIGVAWVIFRGALQHGHRARVVARATIRCRRIVAIELATCRSGRMGGASGLRILGKAKRRELIGGIASG